MLQIAFLWSNQCYLSTLQGRALNIGQSGTCEDQHVLWFCRFCISRSKDSWAHLLWAALMQSNRVGGKKNQIDIYFSRLATGKYLFEQREKKVPLSRWKSIWTWVKALFNFSSFTCPYLIEMRLLIMRLLIPSW